MPQTGRRENTHTPPPHKQSYLLKLCSRLFISPIRLVKGLKSLGFVFPNRKRKLKISFETAVPEFQTEKKAGRETCTLFTIIDDENGYDLSQSKSQNELCCPYITPYKREYTAEYKCISPSKA